MRKNKISTGRPLAMVTGGVVPADEGALFGVAALTLQEELLAFSAAQSAYRVCISSHILYASLNAASLRRTAAVVRDRSDVFDEGHFETAGSKSADSGFTAGTGSLDIDFD